MGPTNVALVKLFRAEQALREAQGRLDSASKNVRVQERKVNDLVERVKVAHAKLREFQAKGGEFELDVKTREARIEKLRTQQQTANNNKEYQAFLVEISTEKVDRGKAEDELLKVMEQIEKGQAEVKDLTSQLEAEQQKHATLKAQIGDTVARLSAEVEALRPARAAAAESVPPRHLHTFERLADRFDGEALSALAKPDRRREEYLCEACHMDLVADVYNRLHSRDDLIVCTSCGRMLYIPEDLPPEVAINSRGKSEAQKEGTYGAAAPKTKRAKSVEKVEKLDPSERRAKGKLGTALTKAQGESVKIAAGASLKPIECDVLVDGKPQGVYKGRNAEHLQRVMTLALEEAGLKGVVEVREKALPPSEPPAPSAASVDPTPGATSVATSTAADATPDSPSPQPAPAEPSQTPDSASVQRSSPADLVSQESTPNAS